MTILAIDTSNLTLGAALTRDGKVIAEHISHLKKIILSGRCRQLMSFLKNADFSLAI